MRLGIVNAVCGMVIPGPIGESGCVMVDILTICAGLTDFLYRRDREIIALTSIIPNFTILQAPKLLRLNYAKPWRSNIAVSSPSNELRYTHARTSPEVVPVV